MAFKDMLEREIAPGDYVVFYSKIYQVIELLGTPRSECGMVRVKLIDASKTTRSVKKNSDEMCIIDKDDVLIWKIKRGY